MALLPQQPLHRLCLLASGYSKLLQLMRVLLQVSVAASGPLTPRLWRVRQGTAPLRETLAAAAVFLSPILNRLSLQDSLTVLDPMCGSGALLLELMGIAAGSLPNSPRRSFPFFSFPNHSMTRFNSFLDCLDILPHPKVGSLRLLGCDNNKEQLESAKLNVEAFRLRSPRLMKAEEGLDDEGGLPCPLSLTHSDFSPVLRALPPQSVVLTNAPYGVRSLRGDKRQRTMRRLEKEIASNPNIRSAYLIAPGRSFRAEALLPWRPLGRFSNSGIDVQLLEYNRDTLPSSTASPK
ncbi:RNA methylase family protein [Cyclospora cayetanensis]|uniref:RNA methylase family protein n=1 Tax=Cyclospora cayetanensis TaxID=88456 RepID=A0A1D3D6W2_9EIME|nr:RNA methylase family protein [Cyclospora cayetanensis]